MKCHRARKVEMNTMAGGQPSPHGIIAFPLSSHTMNVPKQYESLGDFPGVPRLPTISISMWMRCVPHWGGRPGPRRTSTSGRTVAFVACFRNCRFRCISFGSNGNTRFGSTRARRGESPRSRIVGSRKAQDAPPRGRLASKSAGRHVPASGQAARLGIRSNTAPADEAVQRFRDCKRRRPKLGSS